MLFSATSVLGLLALSVAQVDAQAKPAGKKIYWVGHSFHMFLPTPVENLAKEAGIVGHQSVGKDMIGGSTPAQHWNKGGAQGTNPVKDALKAGSVDILTLASRDWSPEPGVENFGKLAFEGNKNIRVMYQETWLPNSTLAAEGCSGGFSGCSNRNAATADGLQETLIKLQEPYKTAMRKQLTGLNTAAGKEYCSLVPVWEAALNLRIEVANGKVPGVTKQSDMFFDNLGHAKQPLSDLASYMWFAAIYGINPQGMKSLAKADAPAGQAAILQKIAWDTLQKEALNGLKLIGPAPAPGLMKKFKA